MKTDTKKTQDAEKAELAGLPCSAIFRYPKGHEALRTATVGELREWLASFPSAMPVLATWEGTVNAMASASVEMFAYRADEKTECLIFDVER